jgi:putative CocE/NonD family hydrolase
MVDDQRFAEARKDVLTYRSGVLRAPVTIAGPITADLYVSTSGTDADFVVKVIDVYPANAAGKMAGYENLLRAEVMRAKFRDSYENPQPLTPGAVTHVAFEMTDLLHTFRPGHRIMVQVQSSWFPLVDRNPQTFVDIYRAVPEDFQKATIRIYHSPSYPSRVRIGVLPGDD